MSKRRVHSGPFPRRTSVAYLLAWTALVTTTATFVVVRGSETYSVECDLELEFDDSIGVDIHQDLAPDVLVCIDSNYAHFYNKEESNPYDENSPKILDVIVYPDDDDGTSDARRIRERRDGEGGRRELGRRTRITKTYYLQDCSKCEPGEKSLTSDATNRRGLSQVRRRASTSQWFVDFCHAIKSCLSKDPPGDIMSALVACQLECRDPDKLPVAQWVQKHYEKDEFQETKSEIQDDLKDDGSAAANTPPADTPVDPAALTGPQLSSAYDGASVGTLEAPPLAEGSEATAAGFAFADPASTAAAEPPAEEFDPSILERVIEPHEIENQGSPLDATPDVPIEEPQSEEPAPVDVYFRLRVTSGGSGSGSGITEEKCKDSPCGLCEGDCGDHDDCEGDLLCFKKDDMGAPGQCQGERVNGKGYCIEPYKEKHQGMACRVNKDEPWRGGPGDSPETDIMPEEADKYKPPKINEDYYEKKNKDSLEKCADECMTRKEGCYGFSYSEFYKDRCELWTVPIGHFVEAANFACYVKDTTVNEPQAQQSGSGSSSRRRRRSLERRDDPPSEAKDEQTISAHGLSPLFRRSLYYDQYGHEHSKHVINYWHSWQTWRGTNVDASTTTSTRPPAPRYVFEGQEGHGCRPSKEVDADRRRSLDEEERLFVVASSEKASSLESCQDYCLQWEKCQGVDYGEGDCRVWMVPIGNIVKEPGRSCYFKEKKVIFLWGKEWPEDDPDKLTEGGDRWARLRNLYLQHSSSSVGGYNLGQFGGFKAGRFQYVMALMADRTTKSWQELHYEQGWDG